MQVPRLQDFCGWRVNDIIFLQDEEIKENINLLKDLFSAFKEHYLKGDLEDEWLASENLYKIFYRNWEIILYQSWEDGWENPLKAIEAWLFWQDKNTPTRQERKERKETKMKYTMTRQQLQDMIDKARYDMLDCITKGTDYQRRWYAAYTAKTDTNYPTFNIYYPDLLIEISEVYKRLKSLPKAEIYEMTKEEFESFTYEAPMNIKDLAPELPESD